MKRFGSAFVLMILAACLALAGRAEAQSSYSDDRFPHLFAPRDQQPRLFRLPPQILFDEECELACASLGEMHAVGGPEAMAARPAGTGCRAFGPRRDRHRRKPAAHAVRRSLAGPLSASAL
ncbi:hypothetical protein BN1110_04927 [bacterium YEK0313]|nr:hypothetical protein BN1110_04927 [bacterium YEK0313]